MRRTAVKPKRICQLAREFGASERHCAGPNGVRPRKYDDSLIIAVACIQNLHQFSFREALEFSEDYFNDLPTLSTYHYRLERIPKDTIQRFIEYLGKKVIEASAQNVRFFILDGTGFSFKDTYPLKFYRGTEIRNIRAHVKILAVAGVLGKRRFVFTAKAGPPYASEIKLAEPLVPQLPSGSCVLGDKGFDCIRLLEAIILRGCVPVIAIKETARFQIRNPLRLLSKKNAAGTVYKKRTLIEGLFGNTKQKLASHVRVFNLEIAKVFALLRFALFNMAILAAFEKAKVWIWFSNSPMICAIRPLCLNFP
ncbi:MAG: transposase [Candidatus Omnitrophota bacterium]